MPQLNSAQSQPLHILEGMTSISALLHARLDGINDRPIFRVLVARSKQRAKYREIGFLKANAQIHGYTVELCDDTVIDQLANGTTHGGILAQCGERTYRNCEDIPDNGFWVLPDGIEDPFNLGSRSGPYMLPVLTALCCQSITGCVPQARLPNRLPVLLS